MATNGVHQGDRTLGLVGALLSLVERFWSGVTTSPERLRARRRRREGNPTPVPSRATAHYSDKMMRDKPFDTYQSKEGRGT